MDLEQLKPSTLIRMGVDFKTTFTIPNKSPWFLPCMFYTSGIVDVAVISYFRHISINHSEAIGGETDESN